MAFIKETFGNQKIAAINFYNINEKKVSTFPSKIIASAGFFLSSCLRKTIYRISKIYPCFILVLFIIVFLFYSENLEAKNRTVKIGVFQAAPMVLINNEEPDGLFIDLIKYISLKQNWDIVFVKGTWSEHLANLEKGELDILPAVGHTPEREAIFDFSKYPIYIDSGVVFTSPKFALHTVFDLRDKKVAALKGSIFTKGFEDYIGSFGVQCEIVYTKDNIEVMKLISSGKADAGVCIYSLGNELMKEYPVKITPINFTPLSLMFAVPRGKNQDLLSGINLMMDKMSTDPASVYNRSFRKWTTPEPTIKTPLWPFLVIIGLIAAGFIMAIWNFMLKKQVSQKTIHLEKEISNRKKAEENLNLLLNEKEVLLRELFHRTKNTMQVISGLLNLQANEFHGNKEIKKLVKNTDERIQSISLVHQMLYKSNNLSRIKIKEYIENLTGLILSGYVKTENRISIELNIEDHQFIFDSAIPLGLIINELITNSIKHAFPDDLKGKITISMSKEGENKYILNYADNGVGFPEGFDFNSLDSLGMKLINTLIKFQMKGNVSFNSSNGISCRMEIDTSLYEERV